jgi:ParB/RepB/Spo0J family partition protein
MSTTIDSAKKVEILNVNLEQLHESPFNRRRTWGDLKELAASIGAVGILEPLMVRAHPTKNSGALELVFGHRRLRAAKLAELKTAPVVVRELTDEQAIEIQAVENLQRQDIHPLEEAEQYEQLVKIGRSADDIAAKVGKSKSYVHQRLKLLSLCETVRKAFADDRITPGIAVLIARIPSAEAQIEAMEECAGDDFEPPRTVADAREWIEQQFMLRLDDAAFDRGDAELVPKAGPCTTCHKRTGAQKELFADVKSGDLCTDRKCFEGKVVAHGKRRLEIAKESGTPVLEGKNAEKVLNEARAWRGPKVDLGEVCNEDPKRRTFGALIKAAGGEVKTSIALDRSSNVHELADRADVVKATKKLVKVEKEYERPSSTSSSGNPMRDQEKRWREEAEKKRVQTFAVMATIVAAAEKKVEGTAFWPFLARTFLPSLMHDAAKWICKRRGIEIPKRQHGVDDPIGALRRALDKMDHVEAKGLAIEAVTAAVHTYSFSSYGDKTLAKELLDVAAFYKVDATKIAAASLVASRKVKAEKKAAKKGSKKKAKAS